MLAAELDPTSLRTFPPFIRPGLDSTRTVPSVFAMVADPVGSGFVKSLSRPGGNVTGFIMFEYSLCAKWLELLKEIAPFVTRAAVLWDPNLTDGIGQFAVIQSAASSFRVEVSPINISDAPEIESAIASFATSASGGLISTASAQSLIHRDLIIRLAMIVRQSLLTANGCALPEVQTIFCRRGHQVSRPPQAENAPPSSGSGVRFVLIR